MNALVSSEDKFGQGIPVNILMRKILDSENLGTAIKCVYDAEASISVNFMIGAPSEIIDLEKTPKGTSYIFPEKGFLVH
ncbi:MAG: hypothetical protein QW581_05145 [Archaeoglobaceae archaeon]